MMKKNNVYGIIGIGVKNSNYNAGFDKFPKTNGDYIYASPQSFCFAIREQLYNQGKKVLFRKTTKEDGNVNGLSERYYNLFQTEDVKKEVESLRRNLLNADDIKLFGCVYPGASNFSVVGAVQIGYGFNKYENTNIIKDIVLSPFANNKNGEKSASTMGEVIITDKAHYLHSFTINPFVYNEYIMEGFEGFTEEDYQMFKSASLIAVSNLNTRSKFGCQNEFGLFVEMKDEVKNLINLNGLDEYVKVYDDEESEKVVYDLEQLKRILIAVRDKVKSIEIYYNPYTLKIKGLDKLEAKTFNIITREEI